MKNIQQNWQPLIEALVANKKCYDHTSDDTVDHLCVLYETLYQETVNYNSYVGFEFQPLI